MVETSLRVLPAVLLPLVAVGAGGWVYRDAKRRGRDELAPFLAVGVTGAFLAGVVPSLVALAVATDVTAQGFPTALRVIPGFTLLGGYLLLRGRIGN